MSPIFTFDPFREIEQLQRRMDRLFETLWGERPFWRPGVYPLVNISETKDHVLVRAELPGVKPEDVEVTLKNRNLVIRGERKIPSEGEEVNYHRRERESGFFRRVVHLPVMVDPNQVEAALKDGVLTITLSKPEEVKPRQIQVKSV